MPRMYGFPVAVRVKGSLTRAKLWPIKALPIKPSVCVNGLSVQQLPGTWKSDQNGQGSSYLCHSISDLPTYTTPILCIFVYFHPLSYDSLKTNKGEER